MASLMAVRTWLTWWARIPPFMTSTSRLGRESRMVFMPAVSCWREMCCTRYTGSSRRASIRSDEVMIPTTLLPCTTGRWCTPLWVICRMASNRVALSSICSGLRVMMRAIGVSGARPRARARVRRSRSVTMPSRRSSTMISTDDTRRSDMAWAVSCRLASGGSASGLRLYRESMGSIIMLVLG